MKLFNLGFNRKNGSRPRSAAPRKLRVETLERRELLAADFPAAASDAPSVVVTTCLDVVDPTDGAISLREAIEAINSGEAPASRITFDIADGSAAPVITLDPELGELKLTSDAQIDGSFGDARVAVDAGGALRGLAVEGAADSAITVTVSNFAILRGASDDGAGLSVEFADATLVNCVIENCYATGYGGAISVSAGASATATGLTLAGNFAKYGGAISNLGVCSVSDALMSDNLADYGGAVYTGLDANTSLIDVTAVRNGYSVDSSGAVSVTAKYGGGICNYGSVEASGASLFESNFAYFGGAYYGAGEFTVVGSDAARVTFSGNRAIGVVSGSSCSYGFGGAIYNSSRTYRGVDLVGDVSLSGADFISNEATKYGGAISNYGMLTIAEASFTQNESGAGGALQTACGAELADCVFSQNAARLREFLLSSSELYGLDYGGNGGALYVTNNATTGQTSSVKFSGSVAFASNAAENTGGAIDLVSGELCFSAGNVAFAENTAEVLGGAVVLGGDVEFAAGEDSAPAAAFEFTENASNRYAPAVAVMTKPTSAEADALRDAFGLDEYSDALETFARYRTADIAYADLSFEYLADAIGASAEKIVATVSGTETGATLRPGDRATLRELGIGEVGEYEILCHANNDSKFAFAFHYTVTEFPSLTVWKEPSFDPNVAGISVRSYALDPIASWTVDWGDGESETFDALGFAQTAFHYYAEPGEYAATLEVVLANGLSETFDGVVFTTVAGEET